MARTPKSTSIMMATDAGQRPLPPLSSVKVPSTRPNGQGNTTLPYENLAFEGGGAKGYAYIGAIRVLEEEGIYPLNIRRVTGTSIGALFALFAALGMSSQYMQERIPADIEALAKDGRGGPLGSLARAARRKGMNPGERLFRFIGEILEDVTGSADITFRQLHERCGRELAIPVTNVSRMMTEYCHLKTTPNMAVRLAARMSMSLPVLLQPVRVRSVYHSFGADDDGDLYVDGGLLSNNPIHAFDGWWLSMDRADSFLRRMQPIDHASVHYPRAARFSPANPRTLGFTLFDAEEYDITRGWLLPGAEPPARPVTKAARRCAELEAACRLQIARQQPIQRLWAQLDRHDRNHDGLISHDELRAALADGAFSAEDLMLIFETTDVSAIFRKVDANGDDTIEFGELLAYLETRGLDVTTSLVGFPPHQPRNLVEFARNMFEAISRDLTRSNQTDGDRVRTVPINTDYIGTTNFDLAEADLQFLIDSGMKHTRVFFDAHR